MPFKTPKFWAKKSPLALLTLPLTLPYYVGMLLDSRRKKTQKITKRVICVGNFTSGGAGKTPVAIAIGKLLQEEFNAKDDDFVYLSSGYKGEGADFLSLRQGNYKPTIVGDEPLLLNEIAPTFVSKTRLFGARQIDKLAQVRAVILDDGMQNVSLHKDLVIAVVDAKSAFGNGFLIPSGPMRQPLKMGLKHPDFIVIVGDAPSWLLKKLEGKKNTNAKITANNLDEFNDSKLLAFCGLAYPNKFFSYLDESGLNVVENESFKDHHAYEDADLARLCNRAQKLGAKLITTKKDWIKFSPFYKQKIQYLDIELEFLDKEFMKNELKKVIGDLIC